MAKEHHISVTPTSQINRHCSSCKDKTESLMTRNSYLYDNPNVVERLTQGAGETVKEYQSRAAGHIALFEKMFLRDLEKEHKIKQ